MKETVIRYLPLFLNDLTEAVSYIRDTLQNDKSADDLVNAVEEAIINRSNTQQLSNSIIQQKSVNILIIEST